MRRRLLITLVAIALAGAAACGGGDDDSARPSVAVTTPLLADVVEQIVGDQADVVVIMPRGASPHDFQASARQAADLAGADAIVANGGGFEEGLVSVIDAAAGDGVPVIEALAALDEAEDGATEDDHDAGGHDHAEDAHFFTDPLLMAEAVAGIAEALAADVSALDEARLDERAAAVVSSLEDLHAELEATLAGVPDDRRILVTDHDVLGSFADRYGFELVATIIPAASTTDGVSGGDLAELARVLRSTGVTAIFTEATASEELASTLADEVGEVEVVAIHAETLGPEGSEAGTYAGMLRTNAARIAEALGG